MNKWHLALSLLGVIGALCLLYGFFIEPKRIHQRLVAVTIPVSHVTNLSKPLKIVFFSDIHLGPRTTEKDLARQMQAIMQNEPDAIIFGGDLVEEATPLADKAFSSMAISAFASLEAPFGKWAVFGNHDLEAPRFRQWTEDVFKASGFTILENEGINLDGLPVWCFEDALHGAPALDADGTSPLPQEDIENISRKRDQDKTDTQQSGSGSEAPFTLFISHEPDTALLCQAKGVTGLMLSGHSHYGQVTLFGLPIVRVPGAKHFVKGDYDAGSDFKLIISAGLGTVHIHARFFAKPDIVTVVFQPSTTATEITYSFK